MNKIRIGDCLTNIPDGHIGLSVKIAFCLDLSSIRIVVQITLPYEYIPRKFLLPYPV